MTAPARRLVAIYRFDPTGGDPDYRRDAGSLVELLERGAWQEHWSWLVRFPRGNVRRVAAKDILALELPDSTYRRWLRLETWQRLADWRQNSPLPGTCARVADLACSGPLAELELGERVARYILACN